MQIGQSDKSNASEYKMAWGHTIYHELMHLDPVIADKEVWDVAYGACNVARLAKKNGCTGDSKWPGWDPAHDKANSMNNADSFAFFASAAYFQDAFTLDKPGEAPDCDTSATDVADYTADVEGILYPPDDMVADLQNAQAPPDPSPDEIPAPDGPTPVYPIDPNSPPSGLATPFAGASAYFVSQPDASTTAAAAPTSGTPNSATASRSDGERFLHPATALVPPAS